MGSREIQVTGRLSITVPAGAMPALAEMLRVATEHRGVLRATVLSLVFPGDPAMQSRWDEFVAAAGVELALDFDPLLGELDAQDRQVIAEYVSTRSGDVYLDVFGAQDRLQRLVRAVGGQNTQQTALALRKLSFIRGVYRDQLWHEGWGLNLTLLHQLLTEPDNSGIVAAIHRIPDMHDTRVQYLRNFVVACKQRGVI